MDVAAVMQQLSLFEYRVVGDNAVMACPWPAAHQHGDAHPSFAISLKTGAWICYAGCGAGSLGRLVELVQGWSAGEARLWLQHQVALPSFQWDVTMGSGGETGGSAVEQVAAADYAQASTETMSSYILDRGFTWRTIKGWGLRYDRGLPAIMIPVFDAAGTVVQGVIRRLVPPEPPRMPRYLYTPGFRRALAIFGEWKAEAEAETVWVVEGPLDAIWLHQHGFRNVAGLMGSHCSVLQAEKIARLGSRAILALDSDPAGREAAARVGERLIRYLPTHVINVGPEKDVQELAAAELLSRLQVSSPMWALPS